MEPKQFYKYLKLYFILNKIFGLWPGREESKYYKYYSVTYVFITFVFYSILLTVNLFFTPRQLELVIPEVIFFFTEISTAGKVFLVLFKRKEILELFHLLDSEMFRGNYDEVTKTIIQSSLRKYMIFTKMYIILPHIPYSALCIVPVFLHWKFEVDLNLPISKYYFLSDQVRNDYFSFWYIYQCFPIYGHMIYNITNDTFIAGLIYMAITQVRLINYKLSNLSLSIEEKMKPKSIQDDILMSKLIDCLKHYQQILEYCAIVQKIISVAIFFMFGVASIIICISLCSLILLPLTMDGTIFLIGYLSVMVGQLFIPTLLGSELVFENRELVFAAMKTDWIGRPKAIVKSLVLFMGRANNPVVLSGMKFFPLVLSTFISILKMAYSFFTLVRNMQIRQTES